MDTPSWLRLTFRGGLVLVREFLDEEEMLAVNYLKFLTIERLFHHDLPAHHVGETYEAVAGGR